MAKNNLRAGSLVALLVACGLGAFLRLYLLRDQVLIDDEWHGLYYVIGKSGGFLFTHFSVPGATCIPLNLYDWLLLHTSGWSELLIRLPSVVCGIVGVVVLAVLAQSLVGTQRALIHGFLLAISPVLIFYSRLNRPYSGVVLFGGAAVLLGARWMQSGERKAGVLYVASSVLAVYFHLFAVVAVVSPAAVALLRLLVERQSSRVNLKNWLCVVFSFIGLTAVFVAPALWFSMKSTFFSVARAGVFQASAVPKVLQLLSGTSQPVLQILFGLLCFLGILDCWQRDRWICGLLVGLFPLHFLALVISKPDSAQSAIVLVRYSIVLVPVTLLLVSCGLAWVIQTVHGKFNVSPVVSNALVGVLVISYLSVGPLLQCYVSPNAFTSHGAYQHTYTQIDWRRSFSSDFMPSDFPLDTQVRVSDISPFYEKLADQKNGRPVVEYPMLVGDAFNPLYYYQHFHQRPVIVGYTTNMVLPGGLAGGNVYGNTYVDQILSLIHDRGMKLRFRNMVELQDIPAMRAKNVEFIILHKKFERDLSQVAPPPDLSSVVDFLKREAGPAVYQDDYVIAFKL